MLYFLFMLTVLGSALGWSAVLWFLAVFIDNTRNKSGDLWCLSPCHLYTVTAELGKVGLAFEL